MIKVYFCDIINFVRKVFALFFISMLPLVSGCDLKPKIMALPDSIGDFISSRYPALLADPYSQPEIYNSAASDYGVYSSANTPTVARDDYVLYASVSDYILPTDANRNDNKVKSDKDVLIIPEYDGGKPTAKTQVGVNYVTVSAGDTLYSLSRKYSVPVNDLAVMNNISAPFTLSVGQQIKIPQTSVAQADNTVKTDSVNVKQNVKQEQVKISSDPTKKLPTITARTSSKFSWPVRGKTISEYGAKSNGLFNDGINISAARGTVVGAAENGVVAYAGNEVKGMGNLVIIQHSDGWMTVYAHMDSMMVKRGTKVTVGQKIGTVGMTGKVDEPQLHFEIRKGTKAYNPTGYLKK